MSKQGFLVKQGRLILLSIITFSSFALADLNFKGFATMTGGATLSDDDNLHGYDDDFLFEQNSFLGIQANADLGEGLTAVAQIVARGADSWDTKFEWAYIGYQVNDNVKLMAGRQRLPFYIYSDYLDVGYAYHWVTPPESTYSVPFNSATGLSILLTNEIGDASSTFQFIYGRNTESLPVQGQLYDSDLSNMMATAWTIEYDWLTVRAGYATADMTINITALDELSSNWAAAGVGFAPTAAAASAATSNPSLADTETSWANFSQPLSASDDDNSGEFSGLAAIIDYNDFVIVAELTSLKTEGTITQKEGKGSYLSIGKRFGSVMPHITIGTNEITAQDDTFLDGPRALNAFIEAVTSSPDPTLTALIGGTSSLLSEPARDQSFYTLGMRWDFHPSAAFKVEYKSLKDKMPVDDTNSLLRFSLVTVF